MKYKGIHKILEGKFITRYDVDYLTAEGHEKTYEIISRNRNLQTLEDLQNKVPDSGNTAWPWPSGSTTSPRG